MVKLLSFVPLFASLTAFSQPRTVDVDNNSNSVASIFTVNGEPFVNTKFTRLVEGSPYFKDEWMKGSVLLEKGGSYKGSLKLDLYTNEVHYLDVKGNEFIASIPIKQVVFTGPDAYVFVHSSLLPKSTTPFKATWYLQLYTDSVSLYKYFLKQFSESKPYNSATYEQTIRTSELYWLFYKGHPVEIKKLKDAPALFKEYRTALEEFLKKEDAKQASMDDRMIAFTRYLNQLIRSK